MREAYRETAKAAGFPEFVEQERALGRDYALQYWLHRILPQRMFDVSCAALYRINILKNYKV